MSEYPTAFLSCSNNDLARLFPIPSFSFHFLSRSTYNSVDFTCTAWHHSTYQFTSYSLKQNTAAWMSRSKQHRTYFSCTNEFVQKTTHPPLESQSIRHLQTLAAVKSSWRRFSLASRHQIQMRTKDENKPPVQNPRCVPRRSNIGYLGRGRGRRL